MAEKRTIELEIQDNSKSLKAQYKEAVQELQNMVVAYGEMSEEAVNAAKRAAELKDQIEDTNDLMKSFKGEGAFIAMNKAMSTVASGFSAVEGGLALVGVEGEAVQQTMLKVQAAMALAQGLEGLEDAGRAFKNLGVVAKNALSGIRTGIAATGIGLLLVAVGALVAYWDDIKEAVNGVSDEQEELNKKTAANLKVSEDKLNTLEKQDNILRLQGKTEKQILEIKIKELDATIAIAETNLANQKATSKAQVEAAKRNQEILLGVMDFLTAPWTLLFAGIDKLAALAGMDSGLVNWYNGFKKSMASYVFDPDETAKEGTAAIKEAEDKLIELKNQRAGYILAIRNIEQQGANNSRNDANKNAQEQIDITRQMEEEKNRLMEEGRAKDLDALRIKYKYEKEEADKNLKENKLSKENYDKLIKQQAESLELDTKAINDKYDKIEKDERDKKLQEQIKAEDAAWLELQKAKNSQREQELLDLQLAFDEKIAAANGNAEIEKAITDKFNKEYAAINKKYADEEIKAEKEKNDKIKAENLKAAQDRTDLALKYAQTFVNVYSSLNNLMSANDNERLKKMEKGSKEEEALKKKMFKRDKALRIVQTIMDTASNVVQSVRNGGGIPTGIPFGIAAATMGALQIAAISKAKFDAGNTEQAPSPSAGGGAAPMTANFSTIGSSGINQLAQLQQQPTQAYVVSGEVTSAQALDRNRVQNATL
jgi:hypothetical protein